MINSKPLPNNMYIIASSLLFVLLTVKSLYLEEVTTVVPVLSFAIITLISTGIAVYIKNYITEEGVVLELLQATLIPSFLYTVYGLLIEKKPVYLAVIAMTIGAVLYIAALIKVNVIDSNRSLRSGYTKEVIAIGLYNSRSFFIVLVGVIIMLSSIILAYASLYEKRIERQYAREKTFQEQNLVEWLESRTLRANYDEMKPLSSNEEFEKITDLNERLALFERAVDITSNYLRIPQRLIIVTENLEEGVNATYWMSKNMIAIDEGYLATCSRDDLLRTCVHECTHALQIEKLELYKDLRDDRKAMILLSDFFCKR